MWKKLIKSYLPLERQRHNVSAFSFPVMRVAEEVYKTRQWDKCRAAYRKSVGGLCERCKAKGIVSAGVIVHHKIHLTKENKNDPEIVFGFDNLELLCLACHNEEHKRKAKKRFLVDEWGRVTPLSD